MNSELSRLLNQKESETLEFKGPRTHLDALARSVCGMLNQQGGVVVWGVGDDHTIGVRDAEQRSRELNDFLIENISPRPLFSVSCHSLGHKGFIVVNVPQGADKPYSFQREISVRVGTSTLRATSTLAAGIVEASAAQLDRWEREPMAGFALADCSPEELKLTRQELSEKGRFGVDVPANDEELAQKVEPLPQRSIHERRGCLVCHESGGMVAERINQAHLVRGRQDWPDCERYGLPGAGRSYSQRSD